MEQIIQEIKAMTKDINDRVAAYSRNKTEEEKTTNQDLIITIKALW